MIKSKSVYSSRFKATKKSINIETVQRFLKNKVFSPSKSLQQPITHTQLILVLLKQYPQLQPMNSDFVQWLNSFCESHGFDFLASPSPITISVITQIPKSPIQTVEKTDVNFSNEKDDFCFNVNMMEVLKKCQSNENLSDSHQSHSPSSHDVETNSDFSDSSSLSSETFEADASPQPPDPLDTLEILGTLPEPLEPLNDSVSPVSELNSFSLLDQAELSNQLGCLHQFLSSLGQTDREQFFKNHLVSQLSVDSVDFFIYDQWLRSTVFSLPDIHCSSDFIHQLLSKFRLELRTKHLSLSKKIK